MRYVAIRSEGGLIPYDLLDKIANEDVPGQKPSDFGLPKGRRLTDEISRVWSDAQSLWDIIRRRRESLSEKDPYGTTLTRDRWIVPLLSDAEMLGFDLKLQTSAVVVDNLTFSLSHRSGEGEDAIPVHVEGLKIDLDKRLHTKLRTSPQAMVQEFLNHSEVLWGLVTNGLTLRLLRNSSRTSRPTYIEFDLESILEGNRFAEFALFYRLCHRSRFPRPGQEPSECLLEKYYQQSIDEGSRVREGLRGGVEETLKIFGNAFLQHPDNHVLRDKLTSGLLNPVQYHRQLLLLVYRLLFLMVAEERKLIVSQGEGSERNQRIYDEWYSISRLRDRASQIIEESPFGDVWLGLLQTFSLFEYGIDSNPLGIPPLNGDLFNQDRAIPNLIQTQLYNHDLLRAVRHLSIFKADGLQQRVNYSALDVEELGSVYESLLDYQPVVEAGENRLSFDLRTGSERKSTGSYYTRPELVHELVESALVPVMQDRITQAEKANEGKALHVERDAKIKAILNITVCDPACGSGHFLLAAARRLGKELARIRTGEDEPTPEQFHLAVREVIQHCVYGVDLNPLAVDLCKLAMWLEGHWAGRPLSFLDHRIRCGNSLVGVLDPVVLEEGIPDDAFTAIAGDDKKVASYFKKRNKQERTSKQRGLAFDSDDHGDEYAKANRELAAITEDTAAAVRRKAELYSSWRTGMQHSHDENVADLWTAQFFFQLRNIPDVEICTTDCFLDFATNATKQPQKVAAAQVIALRHQFFHWHLEFPEVYEQGGFDCVLGNPPWERTALEELEFFAARSPEVLNASTTALRKRVIQSLRQSNPELFTLYAAEKRKVDAENKFLIESRNFPLGARGRLNTYALFANLAFRLIAPHARMGMVLQSGLATDAPMEEFWRFLIKERRLISFIDFENKKRIFQDVHPEQKFALVTIAGQTQAKGMHAKVGFWLQDVAGLSDAEAVYDLNSEDLDQFSPNTRQPLLTRRRSDLDVLRRIYSHSEIFRQEGKEAAHARAWVAMTSASFSAVCKRESDLLGASIQDDWVLSHEATTYLPLIEAKQIGQYDLSFSTYAGVSEKDIASGNPREVIHVDCDLLELPKPRLWATGQVVEDFLTGKNVGGWSLAYRDVTNVNNERTAIATVLPRVGFLQPLNGITCLDAVLAAVVLGCVNSFVCDFVARFRFTGRHLNVTTFSQLPIPAWIDKTFVVPRVVELSYTAKCMEKFATACGHFGDAFPWNSQRREFLRCELDAAFAHFYGLTKDELAYILETFTVLRSREEKEYGTFRTRDTVLALFDIVETMLNRDPDASECSNTSAAKDGMK
jgi:hypothetical protein